ncbi:uncharacterized protein LOC124170424 [Ischnura elegans]|uniref:uncharacterized protein LOC124170424 n=1 Tax=Ischnura elegans TaxID=197161 RepID=UPI001ED8AEAB|nr:uncharacterized protein LOC124170424 [Ischnura elegans]
MSEDRERKRYKSYLEPNLQDLDNATIPRNTLWRKTKGSDDFGGSRAGVSAELPRRYNKVSTVVEEETLSICDRDDMNEVGQDDAELNSNSKASGTHTDEGVNFSDLEFAGPLLETVYDSADDQSVSDTCIDNSAEEDDFFSECSDSISENEDCDASNVGSKSGDFFNENSFWKSSEKYCSVVSPGEMLLMAITFAVRYSLPYVALVDLLLLVNTIFGKAVVPGTKFLFEKACSSCMDGMIQHYFCKFCFTSMGETIKFEDGYVQCPHCERRHPKDQTDFFVTLPVEQQLRILLETQENSDCRVDRFHKENPDAIEDIFDGFLYQKLSEPGQFLNNRNNYSYIMNTDGCPIFKSSKCSIWPIYIQVNEIPPVERNKNIILCGIWVGTSHPKMDLFLEQFVNIGKKLFNEGVAWTRNSKSVCSRFICTCCCVDSVARPMIQGTTQFNGYYGCSWCLHKGYLVDGQVKYPIVEEKIKERTDRQMERHMEQAVEMKCKVKGVKQPSPLLNLPLFRIVRGFVPDYMHMLCLGVVRQFSLLWCEDVGKSYYIGSPATLEVINDRLSLIKPPRGIPRIPRSLKERMFWKANEWKHWLLFYSLPCLQDILPKKYVKHWALLAEGVYILLSDLIMPEELNKAHMLLTEFVFQVQILYGEAKMTYNVHQLLHLAPSVRDWGPLWAHSGFGFENANGKLVKFIKSPKGVASQITKRFLLQQGVRVWKGAENVSEGVSGFHKKLLGYPLMKKSLPGRGFQLLGCERDFTGEDPEERNALGGLMNTGKMKQYRKAVMGGRVFESEEAARSKRRNDCVVILKDGRIAKIRNILYDGETCVALMNVGVLMVVELCGGNMHYQGTLQALRDTKELNDWIQCFEDGSSMLCGGCCSNC